MEKKTAGVQYKDMKNTIILRVDACRNEVLIHATPTLKPYAKWKVTKSLKSNKKTTYWMIPFISMSRIGMCMESENSLVVVRAWGCGVEWTKDWGMNTTSARISLWGDERVF